MLLGRRARYYYKNTFIILFTFVLSMGKKNGYTVNGGDECPRACRSSRDLYRLTVMILGCKSRVRGAVRAAISLGVVASGPENYPDRAPLRRSASEVHERHNLSARPNGPRSLTYAYRFLR